jgi:hypothetical protein
VNCSRPLVGEGFIWTIANDDQLLGFAVVRESVVEGIFVDHDSRRQKVATTLLNALVVSDAGAKTVSRFPATEE